MYFRIVNEIEKFYIEFPESGVVQLKFLIPAKLDLEFRHPDEGEKLFVSCLDVLCTAKVSLNPPKDILDTFEALEKLPPEELGKDMDEEGNMIFDLDGKPPYSTLPESFRQYIEGMLDQLTSNLSRILTILRWRFAFQGPPSPFSLITFDWSVDSINWKPVPEADTGRVIQISTPQIPPNASSVIESLINDEVEEPTGHELLRDAIHLKNQSPRSALVIGIAAAEVAMKEVVAKLVPDTQWLVENLPSPPLDNILKNYIPRLPAKNKIFGKVLPPPKDLMNLIKKGIEKRNKIVHTGRGNIDDEFLETLFLAIQDLLWLFDYYAGFDWAFDHIRPETKAALE